MLITHKHLAQLCRDSYWGIPNSIEIGGFGAKCFFIDGDNPILVFRGTNDIAGWLENIQAKRVPHPNGQVHRGFLECWEELKARVLDTVKLKQVTITGHSLGAAMATLAAVDLPGCRELVTFGSPRVGDGMFAANVTNSGFRITRYVHKLDPVPWLPGLLAGYRHVDLPRWFDGESWNWGMTLGGAMKIGWHLTGSWRALLDSLWHDHAIENYVEAL